MDSRERFLSNMRSWCKNELSQLLGSAVENELLDYLLSIESERDLLEYVEDMVGSESASGIAFSTELVRRWKQLQNSFPERVQEEIVDSVSLSEEASGDHMTSSKQEVQVSKGVWHVKLFYTY